jgi:exo-beta-1,3-glucanase (GH17 family)
MNFNFLKSSTHPVAIAWRPLAKLSSITVGVAATLLFASCGGGGTSSDQVNNLPKSLAGLSPMLSATSANYILAAANAGITSQRPFPAAFSTKAVAYSPFRSSNRDTETIDPVKVKQDLDLLVTAGIGLIRIFDSSRNSAFTILQVIHDNNIPIKVMLGAYVNSFEGLTEAITLDVINGGQVPEVTALAGLFPGVTGMTLAQKVLPIWVANLQAGNEAEIARTVALANSYPEVVAVSVGNETMVSWSFVQISTSMMSGYIKAVRDQIKQPVTTDDNWAPYAGQGRNAAEQFSDVLRQIDFASIHTYPIEDAFFSNFSDTDKNPDWDWQQLAVSNLNERAAAMMNAAIGKAASDFAQVRAYLDKSGRLNLPIVIGETGWKATDPSGTGRYKFLASEANQRMYYSRLLDWASASQTTNGPKGIVYFEAFDEPWKGSDDKWGLFDKDRVARCAARSLDATTAGCRDTDALYFKTPTLNTAVDDPKLVIHSEAVQGWPLGISADAYGGDHDALNLGPTFLAVYPATGDSSIGDQAATLGASHYISISTFAPHSYGWGYLWQSNAAPPLSVNMSKFANGSVNFSIKTGYVGKLRIGISSDTDLGVVAESFVLVSNGDSFGYCSGATPGWCNVGIPMSAFKAANPALDLRYILTRFSISDVYSATGNADATGQPEIRLDNIYWAQ